MNEMGSRWRVRVPRMAGVLPLEEAHGHCRVLSHGRQRMTSPGAMVPRSPLAPGDAETPSGTTGEAVPEGDSEQALEWLDAEAAKIGGIWAARYPSGKDW